MPKVKPEKIAGIVALSYLVLIPAAAFLAVKKFQAVDHDLEEVWEKLDMPTDQASVLDMGRFPRIRGKQA
jgi:hypothetical protein